MKQSLPNPRSRAAQYNKLSDKKNSIVSVEEDVVRGNSPPAGHCHLPENQDDSLRKSLVSHDELLKCFREKTSRYFLEAKWGVGATSSREYMLRAVLPKACELCATKEYVCLGSGCMGSVLQHPLIESRPRQMNSVNLEKTIPGKSFKGRHEIDLRARNPGRANARISNILCRKRRVFRKKVKKQSAEPGSKPKKRSNKSSLPSKSKVCRY